MDSRLGWGLGLRRWLVAPVADRRGEVVAVGDVVAVGALVAAAVLLICSGLIHIHLWGIAYRHVATLGPLFLVQAVAALVSAVVLVVARVVVVALACMALMVGTMVGFVLAVSVGIFGFTLQIVTAWAYEALGAELLSAVLLGMLVARSWGMAPAPAPAEAPADGAGRDASGGRDAHHGGVEVTAPH
jgi:hypothetical protein